MNSRSMAAVVVFSCAACIGPMGAARADFAGQPILGPLSLGSVVNGDTTGAADDNDGFDSGGHFFDVWDGGDDVYRLDWLGGDLRVTLTNTGGGVDNDLFVYRPGSLDSTGDYSVFGSGTPDVVTILGAVAGAYFINVDTTFFSEGAYQLSVTQVPAPASAALLLGAGLLPLARRRR